eukprot:gene7513-658_t
MGLSPAPQAHHKSEILVCACTSSSSSIVPLVGEEEGFMISGCNTGCLNRLSYVHCDPRSCPTGELCSNRPFHQLEEPEVETFATENMGHGIRAMQHVARGSFLMEYAGEVIDGVELDRRVQDSLVAAEPPFFVMEVEAGLFIDARRKGNLARCINSSCDPNCEVQKWHDAATGEARIGIFAKCDVVPGEELTFNYFIDHYGHKGPVNNSFSCMGTTDPNLEKRQDLGRRLEAYWDGDASIYRGTVVGYLATSRRHIILWDDGDKERVRLDDVPHRWLDIDSGLNTDSLHPLPSSAAPPPDAGSSHVTVMRPMNHGGVTVPGGPFRAAARLGQGLPGVGGLSGNEGGMEPPILPVRSLDGYHAWQSGTEESGGDGDEYRMKRHSHGRRPPGPSHMQKGAALLQGMGARAGSSGRDSPFEGGYPHETHLIAAQRSHRNSPIRSRGVLAQPNSATPNYMLPPVRAPASDCSGLDSLLQAAQVAQSCPDEQLWPMLLQPQGSAQPHLSLPVKRAHGPSYMSQPSRHSHASEPHAWGGPSHLDSHSRQHHQHHPHHSHHPHHPHSDSHHRHPAHGEHHGRGGGVLPSRGHSSIPRGPLPRGANIINNNSNNNIIQAPIRRTPTPGGGSQPTGVGAPQGGRVSGSAGGVPRGAWEAGCEAGHMGGMDRIGSDQLRSHGAFTPVSSSPSETTLGSDLSEILGVRLAPCSVPLFRPAPQTAHGVRAQAQAQAQARAGSPDGEKGTTMNAVLNSPILASMPAAQMSTMALFKATKLGA